MGLTCESWKNKLPTLASRLMCVALNNKMNRAVIKATLFLSLTYQKEKWGCG